MPDGRGPGDARRAAARRWRSTSRSPISPRSCASSLPLYGADCPVVVAYRVGWPDEAFIRGTLADIREQVKAAGITRTALILVGRVLAPRLHRQPPLRRRPPPRAAAAPLNALSGSRADRSRRARRSMFATSRPHSDGRADGDHHDRDAEGARGRQLGLGRPARVLGHQRLDRGARSISSVSLSLVNGGRATIVSCHEAAAAWRRREQPDQEPTRRTGERLDAAGAGREEHAAGECRQQSPTPRWLRHRASGRPAAACHPAGAAPAAARRPSRTRRRRCRR